MTDRISSFAEQLATGRAPVWTEEMLASLPPGGPRGDEDVAVAFLAELADGGPVLELGVGSGRIALPLAATGVRVDGIDNSTAQVSRLRAKPGGDVMAITIGDLAEVGVEGKYRLIYLIFNTLGNLITQDNQMRCFENVADHLVDGGAFVVEIAPPNFEFGLRDSRTVETAALDVNFVALHAARHDPLTQTIHNNHVVLTRDRVRFYPLLYRYVWPSEMDLMARLAGLRLQERWGSWQREPFTAKSENSVSVYVK